MRPRGTIGDLRRALRDATQRLVCEQGLPGVTWPQAVQAAGLQLGFTERRRARLTMHNMVRAGELQCTGSVAGGGRPLTLFAPAQRAVDEAPAFDALLSAWGAPRARGG